jgi:hypothetical protein
MIAFLARASDVVLTGFAFLWLGAICIFWIVVTFMPSGNLFGPFAVFQIGWVPIIAAPNPADILAWIATVLVALPGIGAIWLRNRLRGRMSRALPLVRAPPARPSGPAG